MRLSVDHLDAFVAESDARGGPGAAACDVYWRDMNYEPEFQVDQALDPFSDAYVDAQLTLYQEISGRGFDQAENEDTHFDLERHVAAVNPYDHGEPGGLALHLERLSRAVRAAAPPRDGRVLDMGCGWGLSSELAAYCGLEIVAVDLNPTFVELVNRRAGRRGATISAVRSSFDAFSSSDRFDMILFYECLHHALRPWTVVAAMSDLLKPGGKLVLAGEPVNAHWWTNWGLRLDPLSVYCIRKFGWFESGWSQPFLTRVLERAGFDAQFLGKADDEVGLTVTASRVKLGSKSAAELWAGRQLSGWSQDGAFLTSLGSSRLHLTAPEEARAVELELMNFRGRPQRVNVVHPSGATQDLMLEAERTRVAVPCAPGGFDLAFEGEVWSPAAELASTDAREISFSLGSITFV